MCNGGSWPLVCMTYGGQVTLEIKSVEELFLQRSQVVQPDGRLCVAARAAIDDRHLFDLRERGEDFYDARFDALLGKGTAQQRAEQERKDTVKGVDTDLLIGPVV